MTAGETEDLRPSQNAEEAFAEFLRRKDAGEEVDFDKFCSERAELADALRLLHSMHAGTLQETARPDAADDTSPVNAAGLRERGAQGARRHAHSAPERIGPYRILDVLGEGGMGIVYLAEQAEPVRRRVALKVIKLGMDTREVVARFEAERQALALLDHPGIARMHDAGSTEDGRPYFVMEHVHGVPFLEYCDRHKLDLRQRLELFAQVCRAADHAHHRGIVHRDIKPSNILVSTPDKSPVAEIIDFGVAKATNQRLTEKTIYTEVGRVIGTPAYMSPEQAASTSEDVDHRTDVYSLGVLLYELLVGELPLTLDAQKIAFDEIVRRIRDEDPPTPSVRWTQLNLERTTDLAAKRRTSPAALRGELRGDLDWITMRALEKERERRYATAGHLAEDVERFLKGEPALAGPPGAAYRVRKYVRRHRAFVLATLAIIVSLTVGLIASITFAVLAGRSEERALESQAAAVQSEKRARASEETALANEKRALQSEAAARDSEKRAVLGEDAAKRSEAVAQARLEEILRLSDVKRLEALKTEAEGLWPCIPEKVPALEQWREGARSLLERLETHKATLAALRAQALPEDEESRARDRLSAPDAPRLAALEEEARALKESIEKARATVRPEDKATLLSFGSDRTKKPVTCYFRHTFDYGEAPSGSGASAESPAPGASAEPAAPAEPATPSGPRGLKLKLRLLVDDGAVVYLNGVEVLRENMPEGPVEPGTLAREGLVEPRWVEHDVPLAETAVQETPAPRAPVPDTPGASTPAPDSLGAGVAGMGALRRGQNLLAVEVHQGGPRNSDLRLCLELSLDGKPLIEAHAPWKYWDRADAPPGGPGAWREGVFDDASWSEGPAPLGYGFKEGLGEVLEKEASLKKLTGDIATLTEKIAQYWSYRFSDTQAQWQHDVLAELVKGLEKLQEPEKGVLQDIEKRLESARTIRKRSIEDHREAWSEAIRSIADEKECPMYKALSISPQLGLVPIGRDPGSGLWEFAHLETGRAPRRGADGKLILEEDMGLVFVLIPGGSFLMGAEKSVKLGVEVSEVRAESPPAGVSGALSPDSSEAPPQGGESASPEARPVQGKGSLRIDKVLQRSLGARLGLEKGDVIVSVLGKPIGSQDDLAKALEGLRTGAALAVEVLRGAERKSLAAAIDTPIDPEAAGVESPVHEVSLAPFFLSKLEMTQGQWKRFTGRNPSTYGPDSEFGGKQDSLLHPVEQVSWEDCESVLSRLVLVLPTEAQWEYAARAGTRTAWWTGDEKESIRGAGNLADRFCKQNGGPSSWVYEEWLDDGYVSHAPVGTYRANAFGLHDAIGNVWEWCRDWRGSYGSSVTKDDGERRTSGARFRVARGGGGGHPAAYARSSSRFPISPEDRDSYLGFRPARRITTE